MLEELIKKQEELGFSYYPALGQIVLLHPELAEQVFNSFDTALKSEQNTDDSLKDAYETLENTIEDQPQFAEQVLNSINTALKSERNTNTSLFAAYITLGKTVKAQPELTEQVLNGINTALKSEQNDSDSLENAFWALGETVNAQPQLAEQVLNSINTALKSKQNTGLSLFNAYITLGKTVNAQPELAEQVLNSINTALKSKQNTGNSLFNAYNALRSTVKAQPQLAEQVLNSINTALKSEQNNGDSLKNAFWDLGETVNAQPQLAEQVLNSINIALKSEQNNGGSLFSAFWALGETVKARPQLAEQVLNSINTTLKSRQNNDDSLRCAYLALGDTIKAQPQLAERVLNSFNTALKSERNNSYSLESAYLILGETVKDQPQLAEPVLAAVDTALASEQNDSVSLMEAYKTLSNIVQIRPALAEQVFAEVNTALKSEQNNDVSLSAAYQCFGYVVQANPALAEQVLTSINIALESEQNGSDSTWGIYLALGNVAQVRPELAEQALASINTLLNSEKNDYTSLRTAYPALGKIAQARPELNFQVAQTTLSSYMKTNDIENSAYFALAPCLKNVKPEELSASFPQHQELIKAAHNLRFSNDDEIIYARNNFSLQKISETSFSSQQRCLNVIMAQVGKENSFVPEQTKNFRRQPTDTYKNNKDWMIPTSFKSADIFGCWFPNYLKQTAPYLSTHDAVYWLPQKLNNDKKASFAAFVQNNLIYADIHGKKQTRPLAEMETIGKGWNKLPPEQEKSSYKEILAFCQSFKYADQEYEPFAAEAARWGVEEERYKDYEDIYQAGLNTPEPFDSTKEFKFGKYTGKFLPRSDVRTGFFGGYTDCCQHFDGQGRSCAISTVKDPYSQLFVIENDQGRIVAGSWVWENTNGKYRDVCFDNIEAIGNFAQHPMINHIYEQAGRWLAQENNCRKVTIGLGYQDADTHKYQQTESIPLPRQYHNQYSDAKGQQVLLAENSQAKPLNKDIESTRFVRDVCFLDINEMDKVSEACFPEGDQQLQKPERLSGLALVDAQKGVVGYCLYDKAEKEIYDMAVLPEYRTDKNASSRKLFGELIRRIKDMDGEWKAELRDQTTYRYLDIMAQRGLVSYQNHGIDHEMSDGSKVYKVSFSVNKTPQKQAEKSLDLNRRMLKQNSR